MLVLLYDDAVNRKTNVNSPQTYILLYFLIDQKWQFPETKQHDISLFFFPVIFVVIVCSLCLFVFLMMVMREAVLLYFAVAMLLMRFSTLHHTCSPKFLLV